MNLKFSVYMAVVLFVTKLSRSAEILSECRDLDKNKFPVCIKDGFTSTSVYLANDYFAKTYSEFINNITAKLGGCSTYTSIILCSLYVPRCKEAMPGPWLPCRVVCDEFVRGCGDQMDLKGLNWLKPLCSLLPTDKTDDKCFKPPNFKPSKKPPPSK